MKEIKDKEEALWTSADVARYLRYSVKHFTDRIATLPDFPKPARFPAVRGGKGHARWNPEEIRSWFEKHREAA